MKYSKAFPVFFTIISLYSLTPSYAMESDGSLSHSSYSPERRCLKSFEEDSPRLSKGDILLLDFDGTAVKKSTKISETHTTQEICQKNKLFLERIKEKYGETTHSKFMSAKSRKARSTEKSLPKIIETYCSQGAHIILFTSRTTDCVEDIKEDLSKTGYNYTSWNVEELKIEEGTRLADYKFTQNMILNVENLKPTNKGPASNHFFRHLVNRGHLPKAVYFIDDKDRNINDVFNTNPTTPVPFFLYHYSGNEKYFDSADKIKEFYQETIQNFKTYEHLFDEIFIASE